MKQKTFLTLLTLLILILSTGCQEKSKSRSSSSANPQAINCTGQGYWTTPGCAGYCQNNPTGYGCNGNTIGGTTSGATTGTTTGGTTGTVNNCAQNPFSFACYCQTYPMATGCPSGVGVTPTPGWGEKYHNAPPDNSSSTCGTYNPPGVTSAYETRKGTITVGGGQWYSPSSPSNLAAATNSSTLRTVSASKTFLITDSMLKVRFKVKPEPETQNTGDNICIGRSSQSWLPGYHKLKFNVSLVGIRADNTTSEEPLGIITGTINTCTPSIDLSPYTGMYPNGMYLKITSVLANKQCSYTWSTGFANCNSYMSTRTSECWTMDIEVAADGTKTFD